MDFIVLHECVVIVVLLGRDLYYSARAFCFCIAPRRVVLKIA